MSSAKTSSQFSTYCSAIFSKKQKVSNPALATNLPIWILRLTQIIFTIVALGVSGASINSFGSIGCDTPSKLNWNVACAALTLPFVIYLGLSTGPYRLQVLPWHQYGQLALDFIFFIFWIAAASTSHISCADICNSCLNAGHNTTAKTHSAFFIFTNGDQTCKCGLKNTHHGSNPSLGRRAGTPSAPTFNAGSTWNAQSSPAHAPPAPAAPKLPTPKAPSNLGNPTSSAHRNITGAASTNARAGMDAIMVILFAATLCFSIYLVYLYFKQSKNSGEASVVDNDTARNTEMSKRISVVQRKPVANPVNPFLDRNAVVEKEDVDDPFADTNSDGVSALEEEEDERRERSSQLEAACHAV